jgi:hypothetical protein
MAAKQYFEAPDYGVSVQRVGRDRFTAMIRWKEDGADRSIGCAHGHRSREVAERCAEEWRDRIRSEVQRTAGEG